MSSARDIASLIEDALMSGHFIDFPAGSALASVEDVMVRVDLN
jgi:hypothetical protein